jgi:hypothetical protein
MKVLNIRRFSQETIYGNQFPCFRHIPKCAKCYAQPTRRKFISDKKIVTLAFVDRFLKSEVLRGLTNSYDVRRSTEIDCSPSTELPLQQMRREA